MISVASHMAIFTISGVKPTFGTYWCVTLPYLDRFLWNCVMYLSPTGATSGSITNLLLFFFQICSSYMVEIRHFPCTRFYMSLLQQLPFCTSSSWAVPVLVLLWTSVQPSMPFWFPGFDLYPFQTGDVRNWRFGGDIFR